MHRMALLIMLAALPAVAGSAAPGPGSRTAADHQRFLAKAAADKPVDCISLSQNRGMSGSIVDDRTIVYRANRALRYVNQLDAGCPGLRDDRSIVTRTPSSRLCRGDIVEVVDPRNGIGFGACPLGQFTPYRSRG